MTIGTRSLLYGYHQFIVHPVLVFFAWWDLYGFPLDPRLWVAFLVHDWGYWGKPNMDGPEGERHVHLGAWIMCMLFDGDGWLAMTCDIFFLTTGAPGGCSWYEFVLYHSRFVAKADGVKPSRLCWADKWVIARTPKWLQLGLMLLTGEWREYKDHDGANGRTSGNGKSLWRWCDDMRETCRQTVRREMIINAVSTPLKRKDEHAGQG